MKIAFNPTSAAPLTQAPSGDYLKAITFDLAGHNIFTRGEMFKGTDTTYLTFRKATQNAVGYNGLVPAPSYTDKSVRFLREDGIWNIPHQRPIKLGGGDFISENDYNKPLDIHSGDFISITHDATTGKITISSTLEFEGDFDGTVPVAFTKAKVGSAELKATNNDTLSFAAGTGISLTANTTTNTILVAAPVFGGATATKDGTIGIVPQPKKENIISYLRGDGTWQNLTTDLIVALNSYSNSYTLDLDTVNLATNDTLNLALAKLEHKANKGVYAYDWVISVTTEDADLYINKWLEIVDFLNSVDNSEGADITDEFVTRKTNQDVTGKKTFINSDGTYFRYGNNGVRLIGSGDYGYLQLGLIAGDGTKTHKGKITGISAQTLTSLDIAAQTSTFSGAVTANKFVSGNGVNDFSAGTVKLDVLNIPTSSGGTTFGPGSNGQILKSNGTTVYWAPDDNSNTWRAIYVNGTQLASTGTGTYAIDYIAGTGIVLNAAAGTSSEANKITINNSGVISIAVGTDTNANKLAINTGGSTSYLTVPYATKTSSLLGGAKGNIVYLSEANSTAFLANPTTNGYVLKFNTSTGLPYWAADNNSDSWRAILVNGTQLAGTGTGTYALNFAAGDGITLGSTAGSSTKANKILITNSGVRSVTIGTDTNAKKVAVNTNGTTTYLTIPYATESNNTRYLQCPDTRNTSIVPSSYSAGLSADFKSKSITGLTAAYAGVITFRPYSNNSDWTGGPIHNLAFDANGIHHRTASSDTWGSWKTLAYISDIPSITITNSGSGNVITGLSASGHTIIATKGNFLPVTLITANTNVANLKDTALYYTDTDSNTATLTNGPSTNSFAMLLLKGYESGNDLRRYRLALDGYGSARLFNDRSTDGTGGTWYDVLTNNNSSVTGDGGSTWGSSITVKINGVSKTLTIPSNPASSYFTKFDNIDTTANPQSIYATIGGITKYLKVNYAQKAIVLDNLSSSNPNTAYINTDLAWYTLGSTSSGATGYAGTNVGFPVSNNANGILWLGTHSNIYGGQLGISSNGRLYYRFTSGGSFSTTANGGSWNKIAWTSEIPTSLKNPHTLTFSAGSFAAKTYDGSAAVTVNIPTHTSHLTNNSGFLTSRGYIGTTAVLASSASLALTGISSIFVNTGDSTLKIYSGRITDAKSDGNICFLTCIDSLDGQSHNYAVDYQARCNISLLPRGGQVYIGTNPNGGNTSYKLYVAGNTYASGSLYAAHFYENSDILLKLNIQEILNADKMPIIKEFDWKEDGSHSYGLIAQELEEQGYSELVSTKDDGYKTVNYSAALSLIVGKLQVKILELEKEIEELKNK